MRERPILFSAPMVRAILDGTKTQTRRLVRNETKACAACFAEAVPHNQGDGGAGVFGSDPYLRVAACDHEDHAGGRIRCPQGVPGDRLWVRETWARFWNVCHYRATYDAADISDRTWKPSIHMLRSDSRIDLAVTAVRVERLQDITEDDARAEGVCPTPFCELLPPGNEHREKFVSLWDSINGERAPWSINPWVWVVGFERVL